MLHKPLQDELEKQGFTVYETENTNDVFVMSFSCNTKRYNVSATLLVERTTKPQDTYDQFEKFVNMASAVMRVRVDGYVARLYDISLANDMKLETKNQDEYIITIGYDKIVNQNNFL